MRRSGFAVAGTFCQKKESHKITHRSGRHKTVIDLPVERQQQFGRGRTANVGGRLCPHTAQTGRL